MMCDIEDSEVEQLRDDVRRTIAKARFGSQAPAEIVIEVYRARLKRLLRMDRDEAICFAVLYSLVLGAICAVAGGWWVR